MAIEVPIENAADVTPAKMTRRTWRVQLESPADQPQTSWFARGHRENATYNAAGALIRVEPAARPEVNRTLAQIAKQEFTAAGVTVTGAQLMALIASAIDTFDEEDAAADAAQAKLDVVASPSPVVAAPLTP